MGSMAQAREPTDALDEAERLLGLAVAAVAAYGRDDLASIPAAALERLRTPDNTVVVLGEFKQGKSSLVNALLGTTVCGVDDDIATAVPTLLRYGDPPSAAAVHVDDTHTEQIREPLTIDAVSGIVLDPACDPHGPPRPSWVEVSLPRKLLGAGMAVIDTPGLGGLPSAHGAAALATLRGADGVLFVSDASQELTATELDYLALALARCPTAAVVEPKDGHQRRRPRAERGVRLPSARRLPARRDPGPGGGAARNGRCGGRDHDGTEAARTLHGGARRPGRSEPPSRALRPARRGPTPHGRAAESVGSMAAGAR